MEENDFSHLRSFYGFKAYEINGEFGYEFRKMIEKRTRKNRVTLDPDFLYHDLLFERFSFK